MTAVVDPSPYRPSKWGALFHSLPYEEVLGAGSAGPGKSYVLLADPFQQIGVEHERQFCPEKYPRGHPHWLPVGNSVGWALHLRRTYPRLELTIARAHRIFPQIDPGVRWDKSSHTFHWSSGFRYQFGHCEHTEDWINYLGKEYTWVGFDELVEFDEEMYEQIRMRVRTGDPVLVKMLKVRSASNPCMTQGQGDAVSVKNPNWVRDLFVRPWPQGKRVIRMPIYNPDGSLRKYRELFYLPATIEDNPDPIVREDYKTRLLGAKPHIRRALYFGDWFATAGSYYGAEWNQRMHVIVPFCIPDDWAMFRSMDWGFKKPGCIHWWAQDPDDNLFCVRELWFQEKTASQVAGLVKEIESGPQLRTWRNGASQLSGPADNQLWEQRGDDVESKANQFASLGVHWVPATKKSRKQNALLLSARLMDHQSGTTTPGIVFFDTCQQATQIIPQIQTSKDDQEAPADGGNDHAHDSILYACAYASKGVRGMTRADMADKDEEDELEGENESFDDRGTYGYG